MAQKYTSANTSINSTKLPQVYNQYEFKNGDRVLDYGCGKYTSLIQAEMGRKGCEWYGYDLFNQPKEVNDEAINQMKCGFDVGICSNVLNVIDDDNIVNNIIKSIKDCCKTAVFFIYEGNKSGNGKMSKLDCWQRNEKVENYLERIRQLGYHANRKGRMIVVA